MDDAIRSMISNLRSAKCEKDILTIGRRVANTLGFEHMSYFSDSAGKAAFISDYPTDQLSIYAENDFAMAGTAVKIVRNAPAPYLWERRLGEQQGPSTRNVFDAARDFGISTGLTIPIVSRGQAYAVLTFFGASIYIRNSKDLNEKALCLRAIGMAFHNSISTNIDRFSNQNNGLNLTEQQGTCLEAAAIGYSTKEIARLINITPRTVSFHLEAAKQRLSAQTLSEAVAIAVRHRIIL